MDVIVPVGGKREREREETERKRKTVRGAFGVGAVEAAALA